MLIDVFAKGMLGSEAENALHEAGITVNKNAIPYDTNPPLKPSGIRIGSPALTTRGMREPEMHTIGKWIAEALDHRNDPQALRSIRGQVLELADSFPLYGWLRVPETVAAEYGPSASFKSVLAIHYSAFGSSPATIAGCPTSRSFFARCGIPPL